MIPRAFSHTFDELLTITVEKEKLAIDSNFAAQRLEVLVGIHQLVLHHGDATSGTDWGTAAASFDCLDLVHL